ncbi:hypothetical protein [Pleomorphomonas carboxyditropha]|nr:hypothetical protein [Pleomorphomonas carboxyditropha]
MKTISADADRRIKEAHKEVTDMITEFIVERANRQDDDTKERREVRVGYGVETCLHYRDELKREWDMKLIEKLGEVFCSCKTDHRQYGRAPVYYTFCHKDLIAFGRRLVAEYAKLASDGNTDYDQNKLYFGILSELKSSKVDSARKHEVLEEIQKSI